MQVVVNGKKIDLPEVLTVEDLLRRKKLNPNKVIIEYNGELLKENMLPNIILKEDDKLEILVFVGGG